MSGSALIIDRVSLRWICANETIVTLLANTGLRVSELVALNWDHVDLDTDSAEISLPGGLQKGTKRDAYLDLEPETARQLQTLPKRGLEND